ncbi:hypothetical protein CDCA_CDCA09G2696 [Cyanidium caldarium]|uniref:Glu-AdT subunit C n=1 Tax=Cyanidium caldarium TaxID=2771 RepID=A0AAV9IX25_CYACA|nr:hypothetical protein CDCA_CDCA09G2696 [Cyanidium caldarium]|eukprot:ctg_390.g205
MRQESRSSNAEVSRETVAYTARLANLSYTDRELDELVPAFREMLHFMDTINSVPEEALAAADEEFGGADVTVTFTTPLHSVLREDAPRSFAEPDALLDAFPDKEGDMLRIPKITSDA